MNDSELTKEFIRILNSDLQTQILVCHIEWEEGPHKPASKWVMTRNLPGKLSETQIQEAIKGILEDPRYFSICLECSERNPIGWMHDDNICQDCAANNHGIIY